MKLLAQRQDSYIKTLGDYERHKMNKSTVLLECSRGKVAITFYTDGIIQVRAIDEDRPFENFSYAVVSQPAGIEVQIEDTETHLIFKTKKTILEIAKKPVRMRFLKLNGEVINEDDDFFGITWVGTEVTCHKKLQEGEKFIGLGEKTGNLNRRGSYYTNWNTDYFGYPTNGDPLYLSTPFYIGIHNKTCYGIFFDNTYKTVVDFAASNERFSYFQAPDGEMNYYFVYGDDIAEILESYTHLTGRVTLPPLWALGFQQCRYSYYPDTEVLNVAQNFRDRKIPADVIYLDIHYMDEYKVFTWNPDRFPDPNGMVKKLKDMGFHVILIVDPGVKIDPEYRYYKEGINNNYFLHYPDGEPYTGKVWPGSCHFPDFTNPDTRKWWGENYKLHIDNGIEGYWNDMNEPATWGKHVPDIVEFHYEGHTASHRKGHNVYGMQMARSTYEGVKAQLDGKRPFVLTRAGYSGVQRYAAVWTGDNTASDAHMLAGVRLLNSMGLTGVAFCGYDVGGFAGEPTQELFARWIAVGTFSPFFRAHSMINSRDAEPWAFGEEIEEISRNYIKLRYRLLPYLYSLFYEATQNGLPIQRSLAIDYTFDEMIYDSSYQNQYLFGPAFLVCPVESDQKISKVYLPEGQWYDMFKDIQYAGGQEIYAESDKERLPLYIKGGSIIPMQGDVQHAEQVPADKTLHIHLYKGHADTSFVYYEDDGQTYANESGAYYKRTINYFAIGNVHIPQPEGTAASKFEKVRLYFHGYSTIKPTRDGKALTVNTTDYRFVDPVSDFDPWHYTMDQSKMIKELPYIEMNWANDEILVEIGH